VAAVSNRHAGSIKRGLLTKAPLFRASASELLFPSGEYRSAGLETFDDSVVRNTRDVDLLVRREDMDAIVDVMTRGGFIHQSVSILDGKGRVEMFLDGPGTKARDGVRLIFSGEKVARNLSNLLLM
jgi:hypothetical protein